MANTEIIDLEQKIAELTQELNVLRKAIPGEVVPDYTFTTLTGDVSLLELFGDKNRLLMIHNMGQGCRYCTLWGDGFNGLLPHLESVLSTVLVSKDKPDIQQRFANARGWRFRMASHGGGDYIREQAALPDTSNMPGAVVYERDGNTVYRKNACVFGPGDLYCSMWSLLGLAGLGEQEWTPQFNYWQRPESLDDGGKNILG